VLVGQTLSGLSHKHSVDVRRTSERLARRGQVSRTAAGICGHHVRDETSGEFETCIKTLNNVYNLLFKPEMVKTFVIIASELLDGRRYRLSEDRRRQDLVDVATEKNEIYGRILSGRPCYERHIQPGLELSTFQS